MSAHLHTALPPDGEPNYWETDITQIIMEPVNASTSAIFILITLYWFLRIRGRFAQYRFLSIATPLLGIGAVGGTIYHGFRLHVFFMYMDWLPILILNVMAAIYFLYRLSQSWVKAFIFLFGAISFQVINFGLMSGNTATNISYIAVAIVILLPLIGVLRRTNFKHGKYVFMAIGSFILALTFRIYDLDGWLPIGTHFLWHIFGAVACHMMFMYIYKLNPIMPKLKLISLVREKRLAYLERKRQKKMVYS